MQGLGSGAITLFGSAELQRRFLPEVVEGRSIAAFAFSEREAGSDVAAIETLAARDGDLYLLNGEKTWISNAGLADFYVVFARTGGPGAKGLSAFVVDAATPACRLSNASKRSHRIRWAVASRRRVAGGALLGAEGEGFKIAMATLDVFRSTVGAAALGFARRALDETIEHVKSRAAFRCAARRPAADAGGDCAHGDRRRRERAAGLSRGMDEGRRRERVTREAAMAKCFATEAAGRVCDRAVQLFGGRGVTRGEIVERLYRDVRALRIYEGASEIQQLVIARQTLGGMRKSAHADRFAEEHFRRPKRCPTCFRSARPAVSATVNAADCLLDRHVEMGTAIAAAFSRPTRLWTYRTFATLSTALQESLVDDLGLHRAIASCCARRIRRCWPRAGSGCSRPARSRSRRCPSIAPPNCVSCWTKRA